ncbi:MAG: hypothetical protein ACKVZ0_24645 [Gemmatimonadales bacterium]
MRTLIAVLFLGLLAPPVLAQDPPQPDVSQPKKKREANLISFEEIEAVRGQMATAYDIVSRLRPQYLRGRGANSFGNAAGGKRTALPQVVLDGSPYGEIATLSQISAMLVKEIRFLGTGDASIKYGTGYDGGAIVVSTR